MEENEFSSIQVSNNLRKRLKIAAALKDQTYEELIDELLAKEGQ